jgi:hypothetical protein
MPEYYLHGILFISEDISQLFNLIGNLSNLENKVITPFCGFDPLKTFHFPD